MRTYLLLPPRDGRPRRRFFRPVPTFCPFPLPPLTRPKTLPTQCAGWLAGWLSSFAKRARPRDAEARKFPGRKRRARPRGRKRERARARHVLGDAGRERDCYACVDHLTPQQTVHTHKRKGTRSGHRAPVCVCVYVYCFPLLRYSSVQRECLQTSSILSLPNVTIIFSPFFCFCFNSAKNYCLFYFITSILFHLIQST